MASLANFYSDTRNGFTLLRSCSHGPKVIENAAGEIIKIFYPKKKLSSNIFRPYAERFCENARQLAELDLRVPLVKSSYFCEDTRTYIVSYDKLPGDEVSSIAAKGNSNILYDVMEYLSMLHEKGVFFRAIHLSNLLCLGEKDFALIDIADLKIQKKPLSFIMRYRNLRHLLMYQEDRKLWEERGLIYWLDYYCQIAGLPKLIKKCLLGYFSYKYFRRPFFSIQ